MNGEHPSDDLQRLLDGRLDAERATRVEAHVAVCARCRRELDALRQVRSALREHLPQLPVPQDVAEGIRSTLLGASRGPRVRTRRRIAVAAGLAVAAVLILTIVWTRVGRPDFVQAAAAQFTEYRSGSLELELQTAEPAAVERFFRQRAVPFATRVFDFGMMGYRLAGGSVGRLGGRVSALFAYHGDAGDRIVCQMYRGTTAELPDTGEVREADGIQFRVYRVQGLTLVFWQEGAVVCVLVSEGDPEQAIALARAKAVKV
jgi:anti-sigma factor RsiW